VEKFEANPTNPLTTNTKTHLDPQEEQIVITGDIMWKSSFATLGRNPASRRDAKLCSNMNKPKYFYASRRDATNTRKVASLLITYLIVSFTVIYSQITSINSYNNEYLYKEFDYYSQTILKYENRLFVQNAYKIEEYNILENGELQRIHYVETKQNHRAYLDGDKYYSVSLIRDNPGPGPYVGYKVEVYDVASSPFYKISSFECRFNSGYHNFGELFFNSQHIMIYDGQYQRYILYDKQTFEHAGYYHTPNDDPIVYKSHTLMVLSHNLSLLFYQILNDNEMSLISELPISVGYEWINHCTADGNTLILFASFYGIIVIDIHDAMSPSVLYHIVTEYPVNSAVCGENIIITIDSMGHIDVYNLHTNGEYSFFFRLTDTTFSSFYNIFI